MSSCGGLSLNRLDVSLELFCPWLQRLLQNLRVRSPSADPCLLEIKGVESRHLALGWKHDGHHFASVLSVLLADVNGKIRWHIDKVAGLPEGISCRFGVVSASIPYAFWVRILVEPLAEFVSG